MDASSTTSAALLKCPSCRADMVAVPLDAHYGATMQLDACHTCRGLWVDDRETLRLTPGSTLQLFELIHDRRADQRHPLATRLQCARCDLRLIDTQDRQRDTPFRYWRCGRRHGRFLTFFDFLREKDFVRPLSPAQVAELRAQVRSVNCSNCGAPIDLQTSSACAYCRTALSMLDFTQVERMLTALLPLALARERRHVEAFFSQIEQKPDWGSWSDSSGLVEAGVSAIVGLVRGLR